MAGRSPKLATYRAKRDPAKTPEPMTGRRQGSRTSPIFVVQEHHASALHWDFRLEHDGVLVSWALPKGVPLDPKTNHLALQTEDHPMGYASFEGHIPAGEYGGGDVTIWDHGTFELEKWTQKEVKVVLHGERVSGRYVLFPIRGTQWMIHRMDPAPDGVTPLPTRIRPMLAELGSLPKDDSGWAYEIKWDGVRAICFVDGGRIRLQSRNDNDLTQDFPEFRPLGEYLGARPCILDGEIVVIGDQGLPDFGRLLGRLHLTNQRARQREAQRSPASYVIFDLLHLDGHDLTKCSYDERRQRLESLHLSGDSFLTADSYRDVPGIDVFRSAKEQGLEGVIAKRRSGSYWAGKRSGDWIKVKHVRMQEAVIGGWTEGKGNRAGDMGALLMGLPEGKRLRFIGKVGTGFSQEERDALLARLTRLETTKNPFTPSTDVPEPLVTHFVRPRLVGEVKYAGWTQAGRLRHPTWRGLRSDKKPSEVTTEQ